MLTDDEGLTKCGSSWGYWVGDSAYSIVNNAHQSCTSMTTSPLWVDSRSVSQASLTLYAESKKIGESFRIAAVLNAGVKVFRCLHQHHLG